MSLKKDYVLNLSDKMAITVTLNICWTFSLWLKEPEPRKINNGTYVDGDIYIDLNDGKPILLGTEQSIGSLTDFLNSPSNFINSKSGLLVDGIYGDECTLTAKTTKTHSLMMFEFSKENINQLEIPITEASCAEFKRVKENILTDLGLMFSKSNVSLISQLCKAT
jgi:hypothetical protein